MQVPSLTRVGEDDTHHLFKRLDALPVDDEGVDIEVKVRIRYGGVAPSPFGHARGTRALRVPARGSRNLPCLDSFLGAFCGDARQPQKPAASTESLVGRTSKGGAENEFEVIAMEELDTKNLEADLTDAIVSADTRSARGRSLVSCVTMRRRRTFLKLAATTTTRRTSPNLQTR